MTPLVKLEEVSYKYPLTDRWALAGLSMKVEEGESLYLAGKSGGGKSTLVRILNGLAVHHYRGEIKGQAHLDGFEISALSLKEIAGRACTLFQNPDSQFFSLTARDDILLNMQCRGVARSEAEGRLFHWASRLGLEALLDRPVALLSSGEKQKAVLAELMALGPRLLLLDEPTANLDPASAAELSCHLEEIKGDGVSIIIVDHRRDWLNDWVDRALILDRGQAVWEGRFQELDSPALEKRWGLRRHRRRWPAEAPLAPKADDGDSQIELVNLSFGYKKQEKLFNNFSQAWPKGRVTALTGPNGAGKTTLLRLISGLLRPESGRILFGRQPCRESRRLALCSLAMQNADRQLVMNSVLAELAESRRPHRPGRNALLEELGRWGLGELSERHPQSLSGGEKQRLVLACALARDCQLLALDEPTSGLDADHMRMTAQIVKEAANSFKAVLLITHDLELYDEVAELEFHL